MSARDEKPKQHAVEDGRLVYISPSAMQKADPRPGPDGACTRQWRFKYVERLPDKPPGKGQRRGSEGHGRIEDYLKTGKNNLDPLELKGLSLIPEPNVRPDGTPHPTPVMVEGAIDLTADGVPLIGYFDLLDARTPGLLRLTDWKFKKSIELYGATEEQLVDPNHEVGVQMIPYAKWVADVVRSRTGPFTPGIGIWAHVPCDSVRIELRHVTFQTEGCQRAEAVSAFLTLTEADSLWETVSRRIVPAMRQATGVESPYDVPANKDICNKYGGCAYKDACLSRMARIASNLKQFSRRKKEAEMGMLSTVLESKQPIQNASPTPPAPAAPPRAPMIQNEAGPDLKAKDATVGSVYMLNTAEGAQLKVKALGLTKMGEVSYASFIQADGNGMPFIVALEKPIVPVGAATAPNPATDIPKVLPPDAPASKPELAAKQDTLPTAPTQAAASAPAAVTPEAPKARRGRKSKEETAAASTTIQNTSSEATTSGTAASPSSFEGIHLYYGSAIPLGVMVQSLAAYADALEKSTLDAGYGENPENPARPVDIRASGDQDFGFGKWKGLLAAMAKENPPPAGHYIVTPGDERVDTIAGALIGVLPAGHVVFGGR